MDLLGSTEIIWVIVALLVVLGLFTLLYDKAVKRFRLAYIRRYRWPEGLTDRFRKHHPDLDGQQTGMVEDALKQFFAAYLLGGRQSVSMPSQAADDLWHEFILYTRAYQNFCRKAFGRFLHHTPAVVLDPKQKSNNEGLRRVWTQACALEGYDPRAPRGLPLLFTIDKRLNIKDGFHYYPNCDVLLRGGTAVAAGVVIHCAGHFSDAGIDGGLAGLEDAGAGEGSPSSHGGFGDGGHGGDGGGCGGGD